jgi:hypothetical protein
LKAAWPRAVSTRGRSDKEILLGIVKVLKDEMARKAMRGLSLTDQTASREASCPECGEPLSVSIDKDGRTGQIVVDLFCEGDGDDQFEIHILTGLTDKDLKHLKGVGRIVKKGIKLKLVARERDPSADLQDLDHLQPCGQGRAPSLSAWRLR